MTRTVSTAGGAVTPGAGVTIGAGAGVTRRNGRGTRRERLAQIAAVGEDQGRDGGGEDREQDRRGAPAHRAFERGARRSGRATAAAQAVGGGIARIADGSRLA